MWPFRFVAVPVRGRFGLWPFRSVAVSVCGRSGLWPFRFVAFRFVAVPVCGRFGLWPFRLWPFRFVAVMTCYHTHISCVYVVIITILGRYSESSVKSRVDNYPFCYNIPSRFVFGKPCRYHGQSTELDIYLAKLHRSLFYRLQSANQAWRYHAWNMADFVTFSTNL